MADMRSRELPSDGGAATAGAEAVELRPPLSLSLVSDPKAVRLTLARIESEVLRMTRDAALASTAELVVAEVLNNVVEHALAGQRFAKIDILMSQNGAQLDFEVRDTGLPMPGGIIPDGTNPVSGTAPVSSVDDLPEGGFGWFLIHTLAENLNYSRQGDVNVLLFSLPLSSPHSGRE